VTLKDRRVSWRTVPTFAAGALATAAGAVLVWCRGAARADSAVTDPDAAVVGRGARVGVDGLEHAGAVGPCMAVSNHRSGRSHYP
jgi:hypothetical protein